ncbi:hypothetical protein [Paraferrimonas sp. SM1919]|uniref:hypothetical protein n=1 Tax=Paraferrimonas sp. SM1919 TaxID=2662263 RepID=UPI0013CF88A5|nr:hypothetical protein [Paraferrimonas sp. SM1919]
MKIFKIAYKVASAISFAIVVIAIIASLWLHFYKSDRSLINPYVFALNHGNLVTDQEYDLIYSFDSGSNFQGDHLEYYCIQLEKFEFQNPREDEWVYGPEENDIFKRARKLVASEGNMSECFGESVASNSEDVAAKIWSLDIRRKHIEGARVILFHKPTKRLLYVSSHDTYGQA